MICRLQLTFLKKISGLFIVHFSLCIFSYNTNISTNMSSVLLQNISRLIYKAVFLPSCGCVGTTVWMHHIGSNKNQREKARWEQHENATYSLEQILNAEVPKRATVRPPTYHLTNHPSKTNKTCWAILEK